MKKMIIVILVVFIVLVVFQSFMAISTSKIEKQQYQVIKKEREFEVRYYPPATFATIKSSAKSYKELAASGFRKIARYIFGNNEASAKIAMTSPVHMDINERESSMSFVMPSAYDLKNLPKPNDSQILVHESPGEYVAAIEFGGYAGDSDISKYVERLKNALESKGIKTTGNFRYLGYNPPYQLVGRKNEIIVAIQWNLE